MPSLSYPLSYDCPYQYAKTATEDALVAAAQEGHEWAFMELYRRNSPRLMRALYRITKNREDAEDALQDCMLRAFIHLNRFDRRAKFSTWFTRIGINSALMILRKRRRLDPISLDHPVQSWDHGGK